MLYLSFTGGQRVDGDMIEVSDLLPAFQTVDASGATFDSASEELSRLKAGTIAAVKMAAQEPNHHT